ncbi:MAG: hypothetical protein RSE39_07620 [Oscillospiraceae bacterium]
MDDFQQYEMNEPSGNYSGKGCNLGCSWWLWVIVIPLILAILSAIGKN